MGSYSDNVNVLEYLRSQSNVDCDSLDLTLSKELGPFVDCTSNQADSYLELLVPHRAQILTTSASLGRQLLSDYPGVQYEELAVEIAMVRLSQTIARLIAGNIHVMSNPMLNSTDDIVANAQRIRSLCQRFDPDFEISRLCVKVVSTWEGLQACRKLKALGIQTLATTLFTMEQAILAAEAGCAYIAPFVHELKAFFDSSYNDGGPNLELSVEAQQYFKMHSSDTNVLAAGFLNAEECKRLAGVDHMTLAPDLLYELSKSRASVEEMKALSLFNDEKTQSLRTREHISFVDHRDAYTTAFDKSYEGKGKRKTEQAISIFAEYQAKAQVLMKDKDPECTEK